MIGSYRLHRLRELQTEELDRELKRPDLTPEMVTAIMTATIEGCVDAYSHGDIDTGDKFARLNGVADNYFGPSDAS